MIKYKISYMKKKYKIIDLISLEEQKDLGRFKTKRAATEFLFKYWRDQTNNLLLSEFTLRIKKIKEEEVIKKC